MVMEYSSRPDETMTEVITHEDDYDDDCEIHDSGNSLALCIVSLSWFSPLGPRSIRDGTAFNPSVSEHTGGPLSAWPEARITDVRYYHVLA